MSFCWDQNFIFGFLSSSSSIFKQLYLLAITVKTSLFEESFARPIFSSFVFCCSAPKSWFEAERLSGTKTLIINSIKANENGIGRRVFLVWLSCSICRHEINFHGEKIELSWMTKHAETLRHDSMLEQEACCVSS